MRCAQETENVLSFDSSLMYNYDVMTSAVALNTFHPFFFSINIYYAYKGNISLVLILQLSLQFQHGSAQGTGLWDWYLTPLYRQWHKQLSLISKGEVKQILVFILLYFLAGNERSLFIISKIYKESESE